MWTLKDTPVREIKKLADEITVNDFSKCNIPRKKNNTGYQVLFYCRNLQL